MKNKQKNVVFNKKIMIFNALLGCGVAIIMVYIFGKLAPIAIVSYRMASQIIKPLIS